MDSKCVYDEFTNQIILEYELENFVTLNQYIENPNILHEIPNQPGIYFAIHPHNTPSFLETGSAGFFHGNNPNVSIDMLMEKWVNGADILYIGQTTNLRRRFRQRFRFAQGANVGAWGGRYLWQHSENREFKFYWYICHAENPRELERSSIERFHNHYGSDPFANL